MVISKKKGLHLESVSYFSIFFPKSRCSLKTKKDLLLANFGNYFLQLIIVTALKFLPLPKFFISLPEKLWFCPNIFLLQLEKFEFCPNLGNLGGNCPLPPGRYGYDCRSGQTYTLFKLHYHKFKHLKSRNTKI